ncbi:hypothetical protein BegalDRAFT_0457 [Beggiatoa alba B18LD]|uniref:SPOR domain-containing protein n=1 Tax=Beggiatoa alba B18LD TaxID=395493 RepID=I3CCN3_9GAMM|nr:hypothetical protein [Beggiatoa alba]EIJ41376.1 hypothetical protein BegalDRAFT_0457 [Beggiatoa alba B18LD]
MRVFALLLLLLNLAFFVWLQEFDWMAWFPWQPQQFKSAQAAVVDNGLPKLVLSSEYKAGIMPNTAQPPSIANDATTTPAIATPPATTVASNTTATTIPDNTSLETTNTATATPAEPAQKQPEKTTTVDKAQVVDANQPAKVAETNTASTLITPTTPPPESTTLTALNTAKTHLLDSIASKTPAQTRQNQATETTAINQVTANAEVRKTPDPQHVTPDTKVAENKSTKENTTAAEKTDKSPTIIEPQANEPADKSTKSVEKNSHKSSAPSTQLADAGMSPTNTQKAVEKKPNDPAKTLTSVAATSTTTTGTACYKSNYYGDGNLLRSAASWFNQKEKNIARVSRQDNKKVESSWVFLPPQKNRQAALNALKKLESQGIIDFSIMTEGKYNNAISFGIFREEARAKQRLNELKQKGYSNARLEKRYETDTHYQLNVKIPERRSGLTQEFNQVFKGIKLEKITCP